MFKELETFSQKYHEKEIIHYFFTLFQKSLADKLFLFKACLLQISADMEKMKQVLVTGGNSGIGFALCKILVSEHNCYVFLGSRNADKGYQALKNIQEQVLILQL